MAYTLTQEMLDYMKQNNMSYDELLAEIGADPVRDRSHENEGFSTEQGISGTFLNEDVYQDSLPNTGFSTEDGTFIDEEDYYRRMPNTGFSTEQGTFTGEEDYQRRVGVDTKVPGTNVPGGSGGWYPGKYLGKLFGGIGGIIPGNDIFDRMSGGISNFGQDWFPGKGISGILGRAQGGIDNLINSDFMAKGTNSSGNWFPSCLLYTSDAADE